jgi:hypothetical protein
MHIAGFCLCATCISRISVADDERRMRDDAGALAQISRLMKRPSEPIAEGIRRRVRA